MYYKEIKFHDALPIGGLQLQANSVYRIISRQPVNIKSDNGLIMKNITDFTFKLIQADKLNIENSDSTALGNHEYLSIIGYPLSYLMNDKIGFNSVGVYRSNGAMGITIPIDLSTIEPNSIFNSIFIDEIFIRLHTNKKVSTYDDGINRVVFCDTVGATIWELMDTPSLLLDLTTGIFIYPYFHWQAANDSQSLFIPKTNNHYIVCDNSSTEILSVNFMIKYRFQ